MFKWERLDDLYKKQGIYTRWMEKKFGRPTDRYFLMKLY